MWIRRSPKFVEKWGKVRANGLAHFLFVHGVLQVGGLFAILMLIAGYVSSVDEALTLTEYLLTARTWFTLIFHACFFGLLMGTFFWYTSEVAYKSQTEFEEKSQPDVRTQTHIARSNSSGP